VIRYPFPALLLLILLAAAAPAAALTLDAAQRQWIAAHHVVRIAPDPDLAPLDGIDDAGRESGLAGDYLKRVSSATGLEFRVVRLPTREEAMQALAEHRVDVVPNVITNPRDTAILYTTTYLRLPAAIFSRENAPGYASLAQLKGHNVAVIEPWPALVAGADASLKLRIESDIAAALYALRNGAADAFIGDAFTAANAITRLKLDKDVTLSGEAGVEAAFALAIRDDWAELREIIDEALADISLEDNMAMRERWLKNAAVPAPAAEAQALPPSQAPAISAAQQALAKAPGLKADERKQVEELLNAAQADETSADQVAAQWQALNQTASGAEAAAQKIDDSLSANEANAMLAWKSSLPERASVEDLQALLSAARDSLTSARASAASLQAEIDRQAARQPQLGSELAAAQTALDDARSAPAATGNPARVRAQELRNAAAKRLATIRLALLQLESRSYGPRVRLLSAQLRERERASEGFAEREAALENLLLDRAMARVADLRARVVRERDEAVAQFRMLHDTASTNVALVDRLDQSMRLSNELHAQKQQWDGWLRDTTQALKNTEERIRVGGVSEAVGLILLEEKSKLKPLPLLRRSLAKLETELAQARIGQIDVREQSDNLADIGEAVSQALARLPAAPAEHIDEQRTAMYRLLATRAEILPDMVVQQTRLVTAAGDAEQTLQELVTTTQKLSGILDSRLLWTPSHQPVGAVWLGNLASDLSRFFSPRRWGHVAANVGTLILTEPLTAFSAVFVLALLLVARRRAPRQLTRIAAPMRSIRTDGYELTAAALFWTVIAALPLPVLLLLASQACQQAPSPGGTLTEEVGLALRTLIAPASAVAFLHTMTLENGLAQAHFRWPRPRREALHRAAPLLALIVLPVQFLLSVMLLRSDAAPIDTIGRLLLVLALLAAAVVGWRLLAPGRAWTVRDTTLVEPVRMRQAVRVVVVVNCVLLAVLVLRGYFVTAMTLTGRDVASFVALLGIATAYGLVIRWFVLGERRLALQRMEDKQREAAEQREDVEGEAQPVVEPDITVASVSAQTRRFLRAVTIIASISLLLWIWSEVTPAVALLDTVPVWKEQGVTLLGVIQAIVVLVVTIIATRNLPGLVEVGLLRRIHIDAATRYAFTSLFRYCIVFAGVLASLSLLGLQWKNLQWLAAGFSVGLGFGLQEIFANFMSGLMVLFERPIRVGDIVTIGTVEGTVTRIRTRATTIVDWDNREVIVPNKSFITDRLINWTLSDSVTRIVIKVGIAYRNDPRLAQRLLLDIARSHAQVLDQPEPLCWMTGFGPSSLDFELRVFVDEVMQRNPVRTELQMRIAEVFREHDIEIAFPQMDLWVRGGLEPAPPAAAETKS
jgi:potassium efflux system protein